jgi:chromate transporter
LGANTTPAAHYSLGALTRYFLKLGTVGFGGPVALVGSMYRDLVEARGWIAEDDYREGLTLAQLMPGPLAAQLAMYLGFVHYRVVGASVVGAAFVLPSFLMVVAIGWAYQRYGGLPWMQAAFYGVGAAVIGIIAKSAFRLTTKNIGRDRLLLLIFLVTAAYTVGTQSESVLLFLGGGVLAWLVRAPPKRTSASTSPPPSRPSIRRARPHRHWQANSIGTCSFRSVRSSRKRARSCSAAVSRSSRSSMRAWCTTTPG